MQNQIKAEICSRCNGKGLVPGTSNICDNCRGIGAVGTDGTYEYYLADDSKGNLKVVDIKSSSSQTPTQQETDGKQLAPKRKGVQRGLIFIIFIIVYGSFLAAYFTLINEPKVLWTVTIFVFGFIVLYFLYDTKFLKKISRTLVNIIVREPDDFKSAIKKRITKN
ncbi:hypothetical protein ACFLY9_01335 [Patescibacteria group bacterium]